MVGALSIGAGFRARTFYVDPAGNDANDGLTPQSPWASLQRVSQCPYLPGETIKLRRGGVWFCNGVSLTTVGGRTRQVGELPVTVTDYGDARQPMPTISGWKIVKASAWSLYAPGVWRVDINADITGNVFTLGAPGANIGRLVVDSAIKTNKQIGLGDLANDWDFYSDNVQYLYVKLATNPGLSATEIKASPNIASLIGQDSCSALRNLHIAGSGGHGVGLGGYEASVQWCWIDTMGGSFQANDPAKPRYGNGIETFAKGARHAAKNNLITDCFDVAVTAQGYPMAAASDGWTDIDFSDNWIARCAQAVEFWATVSNPAVLGQQGPTGSGFNNVRARRLHLWDIGNGSARQGRNAGQVWSVFIQTADIQTPYQPLSVSISEMHNCADNLFFFSLPSGSPTYRRNVTDFALEASNLSLPAGSRIMRGNLMPTYNVEQWANFVADTAIGAGSTMSIEPAGQSLTPIRDIFAKWRPNDASLQATFG